MAEVTVLKNTRRQAVVIATGTGTYHCNLSSLLYSNVNNQIDQTLTTANAELTITDITYCSDGNASIVRNGTTYFILSAGQADFSFAQRSGFVLNQTTALDSNANIQINFGANTGTVVLGLSKTAGFNDPDLQLLEDYQRP